MKTFIIQEKFVGYADVHIEAETEQEAIDLYNRGHYKDSNYFMDLMQNDTTKGKGATYAKLEVLLSNTKHAERFTRSQLKSIKGGLL